MRSLALVGPEWLFILLDICILYLVKQAYCVKTALCQLKVDLFLSNGPLLSHLWHEWWDLKETWLTLEQLDTKPWIPNPADAEVPCIKWFTSMRTGGPHTHTRPTSITNSETTYWKNPLEGGPAAFKPVLVKGQLYWQTTSAFIIKINFWGCGLINSKGFLWGSEM